MSRSLSLLFLLWSAIPLFGQATSSSDSLRFDPNAVDKSIEPCVDFYQYACGTWMKTHPIPADRSAWDPYYELAEKDAAIVRGILEGHEPGQGDDYRKVTTYYAACMDESTADKKGLQALDQDLRRIADIHTADDSAVALAGVQTLGADALFAFYSDQDLKDSAHVIATLDRGSLGMTDRDYYLKDDPENTKLRDQYRAHVGRMLELSGLSHDASSAGANAVVQLETKMAEAMPTREQQRDPTTQYHKLSLEELEHLIPSWPWRRYFLALGAQPVANINVTSPDYLQKMIAVWLGLGLEEQKAYLRWHVLHAVAAALPQKFAEEDFDFYGTHLRGTKEMQPRWKRCARLTNDALGEAVGKVFVERHFPSGEKERALAQIRSIQSAIRNDISTLDWMSDATRQEALRKLDVFRIKVGYPDHWRDYTGLEVRRDEALANALRANRFEFARQVQKIGKPVDRDEWFSLPQDIDGYQSAALVEIVFTAGLLQPPFFDPAMDDAVNFGAIGSVIGHELTHGFDDQGRKFDASGNLRDWWTEADGKEFDRRAKCVADEYSGFEATPGVKVNGNLTLGENTADNGGVRIALMALKSTLAEGQSDKANEKPGGFTPEQRFFIAFGQVWCNNMTPELLRLLAQSNPHSPPEFRVNGVVSNMPEFQQAFGCKQGQPMVRENACHVW